MAVLVAITAGRHPLTSAGRPDGQTQTLLDLPNCNPGDNAVFTRRKFLGTILTAASFTDWLFGSESSTGKACAESVKRIIPPGTRRDDLVNENPANLDSSRLEITPLKEFGIMGLEDHATNMDQWRLIVDGMVEEPLRLTYPQIKELPSSERQALMICRGIFTNNGLWKGVGLGELLRMARPRPEARHISFKGPPGVYEKVEGFSLSDALSGRLLLAYGVNGQVLPVKNGFPLRLVAEAFYGDQWVKYVYRLMVM